MCWNIAVAFRQKKRRKVQYEMCKLWTSLQRKKEAGYAVGNDAPYGYIRNSVTKRNEIDPEAAFYVQLIFQWELMGVPIFEIARRMTLLQVPTPREWHRKWLRVKK